MAWTAMIRPDFARVALIVVLSVLSISFVIFIIGIGFFVFSSSATTTKVSRQRRDGDYENYQDLKEEEGQFHFSSDLRKSKERDQKIDVPKPRHKSVFICAACKCPIKSQIILNRSRTCTSDRRPLCRNEVENVSNLETTNNTTECRMSNKPQSTSITTTAPVTKGRGMDEILYI